jgi:hypothetical protein
MKTILEFQKKLFWGWLILCLFFPNSSFARNSNATKLHPQHERILYRWLSQKPYLRVATEDDCKCTDDIRETRTRKVGVWKPVPNYTPYYAIGDFNSDGQIDFAVALIDKTKFTNRFAIAIFNGSFPVRKSYEPALFEKDFELRGKGFAFGLPRPKPFRLILGPFESDNSILFQPRGKRYIME